MLFLLKRELLDQVVHLVAYPPQGGSHKEVVSHNHGQLSCNGKIGSAVRHSVTRVHILTLHMMSLVRYFTARVAPSPDQRNKLFIIADINMAEHVCPYQENV